MYSLEGSHGGTCPVAASLGLNLPPFPLEWNEVCIGCGSEISNMTCPLAWPGQIQVLLARRRCTPPGLDRCTETFEASACCGVVRGSKVAGRGLSFGFGLGVGGMGGVAALLLFGFREGSCPGALELGGWAKVVFRVGSSLDGDMEKFCNGEVPQGTTAPSYYHGSEMTAT